MRLLIMSGVALLAASGAAVAQSDAPSSPPQATYQQGPPPVEHRQNLASLGDRTFNRLNEGYQSRTEGAARIARAERLAKMANEGDCPGAIRVARSEGDKEMAERLSEACRGG